MKLPNNQWLPALLWTRSATPAGGESGARILRYRSSAPRLCGSSANPEGHEVSRPVQSHQRRAHQLGGIIGDLQPRTTKKGDRFALLRLEDEAGGTKCVLWPETYRKYSLLVVNELPVLMSGKLELSEDNPPSVIVDQVQSLDEMAKSKELIVLTVPKTEDPAGFFDSVLHLMNTNPGNCDVVIETRVEPDLVVRVRVNSSLRIERSEKLTVR